jgi:hypothetical protein
VAGRPEPLARIDRYLAAARIADEAIWDLHRDLVVSGRADDRTRDLLGEAARIVAVEVPEALTEVRHLDALWSEQELLNPPAAADTLRGLTVEADRVAPQLARLRSRHREVAAELLRRTKKTDE